MTIFPTYDRGQTYEVVSVGSQPSYYALMCKYYCRQAGPPVEIQEGTGVTIFYSKPD